MKNLLFIAFIAVSVASCDYVDQPVVPTVEGANTACDTTFNFPDNNNTTRFVLIEEFTGHYCSNCPEAAYFISQMKQQYSDDLIAVAIHPQLGTLTDPQNNPDSSYSTNWIIEEGDQIWDTYLNGIAIPCAMINRTDNSGNLYYWHPNWQSEMPNHIGQTTDVNIQQESTFLPTEDIVCSKIEIEFEANLSDEYYMVNYLVEDSIVDWQKIASGSQPSGSLHPDYPPGDIDYYIHRHVLRDVYGHIGEREGVTSGNGNLWGSQINSSSVSAGDKYQFVISFDNLASDWNTDHLYVVTFVYNNNSPTKEIAQVIETHVSQ